MHLRLVTMKKKTETRLQFDMAKTIDIINFYDSVFGQVTARVRLSMPYTIVEMLVIVLSVAK